MANTSRAAVHTHVHVHTRAPTHTHTHSDGVGRSGTFICIHAQLERLKTEGVVDFFQSIKSARIQRAGLVPDVVGGPLMVLLHYIQYRVVSLLVHVVSDV